MVAMTWLAAAPATAAVTVDGLVFDDADGDGLPSIGEPGLAGVTVGWETSVFAVTDATGRFTLTAPREGIVWVRTPDGFSPTPAWAAVPASGTARLDLGLERVTRTGPLSFVHASDTHIGLFPQSDVASALLGAASVLPAPAFLVITGDITQGNTVEAFNGLLAALGPIPIPFVPVDGNHDLYDGGTNYRRFLGPTNYSFETGGVHFIVLDFAMMANVRDARTRQAVLDFVRGDVARSAAGTTTVAFTHAPPDDVFADELAAAGVSYLFTGHWHSNRLIERGGLLEINTQPLMMGGIDFTPAGYRVATFLGGELVLSHFSTVDEPVLRVVHPRPGSCAPPGPITVQIAAETGGGMPAVTLELDGGGPIAAMYQGGWSHVAPLTLARENRRLTVRAGAHRLDVDLCIEDLPAPPGALPDWPELGGSSAHHGRTDARLPPPLRTIWAASVGGYIRGGSPALADGRLFVPVVDVGDGTRGGVVAFDARTGARLWERRTGYAVHNTPAVDGGLVIFGSSRGIVHAVRADSGEPVWEHDLGSGISELASWLYAAPAVADGIVYIGVQRAFAALDRDTGRPLWTVDPSPNGFWLGSFSAAGVGGGVVVASFSRGADGMVAWDAYDGRELWRLPPPASRAVNTAVVIDGDLAYFGNGETVVYAVDLVSSQVRWSRKLHGKGFDWGYGLTAAPALARGKLIVPTAYDALVALDAATGAVEWERGTGPSVLRPVHYQGSGSEAFQAAPVVTDDVVWIGGADGILLALDISSGARLWSVDLGAPILSGAVPSGDMLFVGTWDGTIQALQHGEPCPPGTCKSPGNGGGCSGDGDGCSVGRGGGGLAGVLVLLALVRLVGGRGRVVHPRDGRSRPDHRRRPLL
jgi:outer membrane protein assembly factor BamB